MFSLSSHKKSDLLLWLIWSFKAIKNFLHFSSYKLHFFVIQNRFLCWNHGEISCEVKHFSGALTFSVHTADIYSSVFKRFPLMALEAPCPRWSQRTNRAEQTICTSLSVSIRRAASEFTGSLCSGESLLLQPHFHCCQTNSRTCWGWCRNSRVSSQRAVRSFSLQKRNYAGMHGTKCSELLIITCHDDGLLRKHKNPTSKQQLLAKVQKCLLIIIRAQKESKSKKPSLWRCGAFWAKSQNIIVSFWRFPSRLNSLILSFIVFKAGI